jgi:hypothetical protein
LNTVQWSGRASSIDHSPDSSGAGDSRVIDVFRAGKDGDLSEKKKKHMSSRKEQFKDISQRNNKSYL